MEDKKEEDAGGWREGSVVVQNKSGGWSVTRKGLFPLNICWQPDPSYYSSLAISGHNIKGRPVEKFAQVKQGLVPQLEDELELRLGQIVKITHIIDKDWYR